MNELLVDWLPELILFESFHNNWEQYLENLYNIYLKDFVHYPVLYQNKRVYVRYHPSSKGKGATFWHLISEGKQEEQRLPDFRRCERIAWPRALIEAAGTHPLNIWESYRSRKGQREKRLVLALEDFSYVVVLAPFKKAYSLVTAYHVQHSSRRQKLKGEWDAYQSTFILKRSFLD